MFSNYFIVNYFHIQILAINLLYCSQSRRRPVFFLRLAAGGAAYCIFPFLFPGGYFADWLRVGDWFTFGFLIMLVLVYLLLWFCFQIPHREILFYVCTGHTVQHIIHCLAYIMERGLRLSEKGAEWTQFVTAVVVTIGSWLILRRQTAKGEEIDLKSPRLLGFAVFSTALIYYVSLWTTSVEAESVGGYLFDLFCCVLLLIILLDMFEQRRMQKQNMIMLHLLRQEQRHHQMAAANVEVINRKCHDLKHQISALRQMDDPGEKEESIQELERAVLIYDSFAKTGSRELDLLLAEKWLLCEERGIKLQYMVDGGRLSFLRTEDLYSLFGNAIDNAIESVSQLTNSERKIVTLRVTSRANCLVVHVDNPCLMPVKFNGGLPATTKSNQDYHGYGMRSMRYITEKYGGTLTASCQDNLFSLDILFPER